MSKPKTVYAECNGKLFVRVDAVMHPLIPCADGLSVYFLGRRKMGYLDIDTAIKWCREEMQGHSAERYTKMIAGMEKAKAAHLEASVAVESKARKAMG